jgi:hypothetical protein
LNLPPPVKKFFHVPKSSSHRDGMDATILYGTHAKFVEKWLDKLDAEDEVATATATAEAPAAS